MIWKTLQHEYKNGEELRLGKWKVGAAFYNSTLPMVFGSKYTSTCTLPGIKPVLGNFNSLSEAKQRVEEAVKYWLSNISLSDITTITTMEDKPING